MHSLRRTYYTDRILFWGDHARVEKVITPERMNGTVAFSLDDVARQVVESGIVKALFEEALAKSLIAGHRYRSVYSYRGG
jgi:hypothetical protein